MFGFSRLFASPIRVWQNFVESVYIMTPQNTLSQFLYKTPHYFRQSDCPEDIIISRSANFLIGVGSLLFAHMEAEEFMKEKKFDSSIVASSVGMLTMGLFYVKNRMIGLNFIVGVPLWFIVDGWRRFGKNIERKVKD